MIYVQADNGVVKNCGNCMYWEGHSLSPSAGCSELPKFVEVQPQPDEDTVLYTVRNFSCFKHNLALDMVK